LGTLRRITHRERPRPRKPGLERSVDRSSGKELKTSFVLRPVDSKLPSNEPLDPRRKTMLTVIRSLWIVPGLPCAVELHVKAINRFERHTPIDAKKHLRKLMDQQQCLVPPILRFRNPDLDGAALVDPIVTGRFIALLLIWNDPDRDVPHQLSPSRPIPGSTQVLRNLLECARLGHTLSTFAI
jgi:hypothetical protein